MNRKNLSHLAAIVIIIGALWACYINMSLWSKIRSQEEMFNAIKYPIFVMIFGGWLNWLFSNKND